MAKAYTISNLSDIYDFSNKKIAVSEYLTGMTRKRGPQYVFDNPRQRNVVWDKKRKSKLIDSLIRGIPVPSLLACRKEDGTIDILDGKQRLTAIYEFFNGDYALTGLDKITTEDGTEYDPNKKTYADLEEWAQDNFNGAQLLLDIFDVMEPHQQLEVIIRWNNGKAFTNIEQARIRTNCSENFSALAEHSYFDETMSKNAVNGFQPFDMVKKMYLILGEYTDALTKNIVDPMCENLDWSDETAQIVTNVLDTMREVRNCLYDYDTELIKKIAKKTHHFSTVEMYRRAFNENIAIEDVAAFIQYFYGTEGDTSVSDLYNEKVNDASSSAASVRTRINEVNSAFDTFIVENAGKGKELLKTVNPPAPPKPQADMPELPFQADNNEGADTTNDTGKVTDKAKKNKKKSGKRKDTSKASGGSKKAEESEDKDAVTIPDDDNLMPPVEGDAVQDEAHADDLNNDPAASTEEMMEAEDTAQ